MYQFAKETLFSARDLNFGAKKFTYDSEENSMAMWPGRKRIDYWYEWMRLIHNHQTLSNTSHVVVEWVLSFPMTNDDVIVHFPHKCAFLLLSLSWAVDQLSAADPLMKLIASEIESNISSCSSSFSSLLMFCSLICFPCEVLKQAKGNEWSDHWAQRFTIAPA